MYTIDDICTIAEQIERNGEKVYRQVSERLTNFELAEVFKWMSQEEERHALWFEAMAFDHGISFQQDSEFVSMGRNLLQEMVKDHTFSLNRKQLEATDNILDLLAQSLRFEQDTILFYEMLKTFIDDEKTIEQLELIIEEERHHTNVLIGMQGDFTSK